MRAPFENKFNVYINNSMWKRVFISGISHNHPREGHLAQGADVKSNALKYFKRKKITFTHPEVSRELSTTSKAYLTWHDKQRALPALLNRKKG